MKVIVVGSRQAIYLKKIYLAGIDSHNQMFRQFFVCLLFFFVLYYSSHNNIFNSVEMYK